MIEQLWNEKGDEYCTVNESDRPEDHGDVSEAQEKVRIDESQCNQ